MGDSPLSTEGRARHVAIIMDGNGRWAKKRALPRSFGHKRGVEAVRRLVRGLWAALRPRQHAEFMTEPSDLSGCKQP